MEKNIFIRGITGTMGGEGFKQLLNRQDRFNIISLVRPSNKNKKLLKPYLNNPNIKIIWGDLKTKLKWECAFGHKFQGSPTLVLLGGYWCPECEASSWNYGKIAEKNPFFAQVWYPIYSEREKNY